METRRFLLTLTLVTGFGVHLAAAANSFVAVEGTWNQSALSLAGEFLDHANDFMHDSVLATFWGSLQGKRAYMHGSKHLRTEAIESPYFGTGHINVLMRQLTHKTDLVIFIPGVFNGLTKSSSSLRGLSFFSERDYHVVVIPNPWSHEYVMLRPSFVPGQVPDEITTLLHTIEGVIKRIGSENIASVNLVGESYGGFLSAGAAALDAESSRPLITGSVTLFSPPLNLPVSRRHFDELLVKSAPMRDDCTKLAMEFKVAMASLKASQVSDLTEEQQACVPAIVAYTGMQHPLRKMNEDLMKLGLVDASLRKTYGKQQLHDLTFEQHATDFTRGVTKLYPPDHPYNNLNYWIDRADRANFDHIRVIGASNDLADEPRDWDFFSAQLGPNRVIVLPGGGHMGFESLPWFEDFLDSSFSARRRRD